MKSIEDEDIRAAMKLMIQKGKIVIEPSSAMVIAAFMNKQTVATMDDKVCFVLSGGNNDIEFLADVLMNG